MPETRPKPLAKQPAPEATSSPHPHIEAVIEEMRNRPRHPVTNGIE